MVVSIIIPVYNGEKYLYETLKACLNQNYDHIEIIVIDDCSTDQSNEVVQQFENSKYPIKYIRNKTNLGLTKSLMSSIQHYSGDYILVLGQDDLLAENHVSYMLEDISEDVSFIHCNAKLIDENGDDYGILKDDDTQELLNAKILYHLCFHNFISSCGLIMNRKHFEKVNGYDTSFRNFGEWVLWGKLANEGKVIYKQGIKALYRRHQTNMTNWVFDEDRKRKRHFEEYTIYCRQAIYSTVKPKLTKKQRSKVVILQGYSRIKSFLKYGWRNESINN